MGSILNSTRFEPNSTGVNEEQTWSKSILEQLPMSVNVMKSTTPRKMVLGVACDCDRAKDSCHIQDKFGASWSYPGDPSITMLGFVLGETPFLLPKVVVNTKRHLEYGTYKFEVNQGNYIQDLLRILKKTLSTAADRNSYYSDRVLWSNFYSAADLFCLLDPGLGNELFHPGFCIKLFGPGDKVEFSWEEMQVGGVVVGRGEKEHYFVPQLCEAIEGFLNRKVYIPER